MSACVACVVTAGMCAMFRLATRCSSNGSGSGIGSRIGYRFHRVINFREEGAIMKSSRSGIACDRNGRKRFCMVEPTTTAGLIGKKTKERISMKNSIMTLLAISGLLVTLYAGAVVTDTQTTITGDGACAKCILQDGKECQLTITVEENGKKVTYYLTQNSVAKEFGNQVCAEKKKVKATGTVKTVDGKQTLVPAKIELIKS
jgi:hypothetical protein